MEDLEDVLDICNHYVLSSVATFDTVPFRPEDRRTWMQEHLGDGTGRRLYNELLASLLPYDLEMAFAGVTLPNTQSVKLHQSLGFGHVGTFGRVGRKFGKYWDVVWFERPFRPSFSEWA